MAGVLHRLRGGLRSEELALQDRVDEAVVFDFGELEERLGAEDAGIVEQDIESPKAFERDLHHVFAGAGERDITDLDDGTLAARVNFLSGDC
jgi:hypothetical protein